jgi:4-amino-4-deoxy-L-arabinose transferase-like glycosyltransferase
VFQIGNGRCGHHLILLVVSLVLCLANLGGPSLWDIDEGKNAEAAREMLESDNWVIPTFNFEPRYEKPALLYWLQAGAYQAFGINEFSARLPSALAGILAVLLAYELGRSLFGTGTGLLGGLILASSSATCFAARFANPDALLSATTLATLLVFWRGFAGGTGNWFIPAGIAAGFGMLAKGPVALALPGGVIILFLLWSRSFRRLWNWRILLGLAAFMATAMPWYIWVAIDSRGKFLTGFFMKENVGRFLHPMENHGGPFFYYLGVLLAGLAPWSVFLGVAGWFGSGKRARADSQPAGVERPDAYRFLWCWVGLYLVFFSLAGTKLPNYILPVYAPAALLTARFLERWRSRMIQPASWTVGLAVGALVLMGVGIALGLLIAGGAIELPVLRGRYLAGLAPWALVGLIPILGGVGCAWCARRKSTLGLIGALALTACIFNGILACWGSASLDLHKAPRILTELSGACDTEHDVRIGCYQYFQPSLVFYCRRDVQTLENEEKALEFVRCPLPVFLFLPESAWEGMAEKLGASARVLARHEDMYRHCNVVVVTNR